jgi:hypothetical protein
MAGRNRVREHTQPSIPDPLVKTADRVTTVPIASLQGPEPLPRWWTNRSGIGYPNRILSHTRNGSNGPTPFP